MNRIPLLRSRSTRNRKALRWSLSATAAAAAAGLGAWAAHGLAERRARRRRRLIPSRRRAKQIASRLRENPEARELAQRGVHLATHALTRAMDNAERRLEGGPGHAHGEEHHELPGRERSPEHEAHGDERPEAPKEEARRKHEHDKHQKPNGSSPLVHVSKATDEDVA